MAGARWGGVDVLVNNAGINRAASLLELEEETFLPGAQFPG